jgi:hypothetical protein
MERSRGPADSKAGDAAVKVSSSAGGSALVTTPEASELGMGTGDPAHGVVWGDR